MALLGLLAAGHVDEAKQWFIWVDRKFSERGCLIDFPGCAPSLDEKSGSGDFGKHDMELPAWVLICARNYYDETHDLDSLKAIDRTLRYCTDVQLKNAVAFDNRLEFNGDETEICCAVNVNSTCFTGDQVGQKPTRGWWDKWSLSSVAMAAASLDFYIRYVTLCGGDPAHYHNALTGKTMDLNANLRGLVSAMDRDFWRTNVPGLEGGFHDFFRMKKDGALPFKRLVNFTLMPVYFDVPYAADEKAKDVQAMAGFFDPKTGFLPLVPGADTGFEGHDLGYLLWDLVEIGDWRKDEVYAALVNGPTADCWGTFDEAYDQNGRRNGHDLRSLETGINISALAKYWGLGRQQTGSQPK